MRLMVGLLNAICFAGNLYDIVSSGGGILNWIVAFGLNLPLAVVFLAIYVRENSHRSLLE